ncbi:MAG: 8-oxo-dGTP diphosphatase [Zavarzinella sp.]
MPYTPIVGTLGYVLSSDRTHVLMLHRNQRPDDFHQGKYNGLGGKLEPTEDVMGGMIREIQEESGLIAEELQLRGTISWPGFGKNGEDWLGFIFLITRFRGQLLEATHEGTLHWIPVECLPELPMWPGDRYFLPLVFDEDPRPFHGVMPYENGQAVSWNYSR